jgi:hypothetical protein
MLLLSFPQPGFTERVLEYDNDTTVCVEQVNQLGYLNFFTWSAKQILDGLAGSEFLKESEWKSVELNPRLALYIKEAADLGLELSQNICPYDPNSTSNNSYEVDDEVDAIRHFVMSSYLTWKAGPRAATTTLDSNSGKVFVAGIRV